MQIVQNKLKNTFSLDFFNGTWLANALHQFRTKQYGLQYKTVRFTVQNSTVYST